MLMSKLAIVNIKLNVAAANEMVRGGMHSPVKTNRDVGIYYLSIKMDVFSCLLSKMQEATTTKSKFIILIHSKCVIEGVHMKCVERNI